VRVHQTNQRDPHWRATEKGDGVKTRSALIIAGLMLASTLLITAATCHPASFRMPASAPVVYSQPRTELLPDSPALYYAPTTTTTAPPPAIPDPVSGFAAIPASWQATAICEEGGRDDPNYGYFGIQEWNGFDGYDRAGDAPLSVQLAWEAYVGQDTPPDAPGECHGY
jgi:hypothetical protein